MIDKTRIVTKGDIAKYWVNITHADFVQTDDDYQVVLSWGFYGHNRTIEKKDMLTDEEGHIYMIFYSSEMSGWVKATCTYEVNDSDVEGDTRREVNDQWLCFVTSNPTPNLYDTPSGGDGHVVYTRVYGSDVHTAWLNLRDSSHQPLRDSEGRQLRVHRSESEVFEDK
jgi:hypothetical protein